MLPSTHNPDAQSGKVALFSNTGGMVLYGAAISYCLMLFSFLCVPSAVLSTFLTGVVKTGSVEKIAPDKLMFPAIFSSFPYWSTEAFLLLLVCMALCLAIAFRICNLVSKYSSCKTSKISILVLAVIGFFPASIALEFLGYSQYSHTLQFIEGLNTGSFLYILDR
ncbi:MAG: hypothetical protein K2Z81_14195, partial [Cyanobacteria bacterium]|nr:hypothetical protein [Cyanobacteriota bacterium]